LKRSGQIPIDPDDAHASLRSLNRASDSLRKGTPLVVFPEGGRSATGRLQEFLGGAFYVAIRAQAPIVPMALIGTYEVLPMNSFHLVPGHVDLLIGKPISTTGMRVRDRDKLGAQVRQALLELYDSRVKGLAPLSANDERQTKPMLTPES
jgi:1-acyl-sn-glycerol-3-phosphate acyltransferase